MPIYEYQCQQCNERHEIIQRFSDAPLSHCPSCGGDMKKLISSPAIQFKGSGFYKTDSRSQPSKTPAKTSEAAKADGKAPESKPAVAKAEPKGDAKPAAKEKTA